MLYEMSTNVAEVIPFKTFKEMIKIVKEELKKNRYVEIWDKIIYSAEKWR
ncbi:hypothetical protein ACTNDY_06595 [Tissierellaceae bacterium HCP3S3_D8]